LHGGYVPVGAEVDDVAYFAADTVADPNQELVRDVH
jgi:hypothetical protein